MILIVGFLFMFIFLPAADAAKQKGPKAWAQQVLDGTLYTVVDIVAPADDNPKNAQYKNFNTAIMEFYKNDGKQLFDVLKALAVILAMGIALLHCASSIDKGQDSLEAFFIAMTEIGMTAIIIMYAVNIFDLIEDLGKGLIGELTVSHETNAISSLSAEDLLKALTGKKSGYAIWAFQAYAQLLVPWALTNLMNIVAKFIAFSLIIEAGMRKLFAPLAICDIQQEGLRSPGVRYMKRYLACYLKMVLCIALSFVGGLFLSQNIVDTGDALENASKAVGLLFDYIAIQFTVIGMMFKAGEIANDIVGA